MRRAHLIIAKSKLILQSNQEYQRENKRQKPSTSPMAANSSAKSGTITSSPIQKSANLLEVSGISSCDVSAILSAGEMDDINRSLEGELADVVQALPNGETRLSKENDKKRAEDGECHVITMDVQAVQLVPQLQASALYFRQKLAVHNFTLYNLSTNEVVCYVWHEGEGELNASVFTSCVVDYFVNEVGCTKNIVIYSDGCGSQNRNATLSNALSLLAKKNK